MKISSWKEMKCLHSHNLLSWSKISEFAFGLHTTVSYTNAPSTTKLFDFFVVCLFHCIIDVLVDWRIVCNKTSYFWSFSGTAPLCVCSNSKNKIKKQYQLNLPYNLSQRLWPSEQKTTSSFTLQSQTLFKLIQTHRLDDDSTATSAPHIHSVINYSKTQSNI